MQGSIGDRQHHLNQHAPAVPARMRALITRHSKTPRYGRDPKPGDTPSEKSLNLKLDYQHRAGPHNHP